MVPIIHMNIRYFEMPGSEVKWFGGGIDLTPHYVFEEDAKFFHGHLKSVCDSFYHDFYHRLNFGRMITSSSNIVTKQGE